MRILPREEKFFTYFNQQITVIRESIGILGRAMAGEVPIADASVEIARLESQGDTILHEIFDKLNQTFITPIDPEDIHALASLNDDVLDWVEDAAHRLDAYAITEMTLPLREMVRLTSACVQSLEAAFAALERRESILAHCLEINRLEEEADLVGRAAIAALFRDETDPIRLLKFKELYEVLEAATDACEDVADRLQNVVVKNS
jgi:predicted phosphate transport protein (TIGR00153 family)